ncbi:MAG TPA: hypothetical protein VNY83_04155, partial [Solirubrobacterales bacterium]|nr:hypothetical protein [Solirubrobacterales bacterium]
GFFFALWDRPEMHLDPEVRRGSTVWHVMDAAEVERGLDALRADLESGAWDGRYGHLRAEPELDVGLRLVVAEAAASSCSRQRGTSCPILPGSPGKTTSSVGTPTSTWLAARGSSSSSTPARSWRTGTVGCWAPARLLTR